MGKDFNRWNIEKQIVHNKGGEVFYSEREIWWCILGVNIGFEQDGSEVEHRRPVLILKGLSRRTCLVIPLTTSVRVNKFRISIGPVAEREASALLSQMRVIDTKRLVRKIGTLGRDIFDEVRKNVRALL